MFAYRNHTTLIAVVFVVLTVMLTWPLPARLTTSVPGDYGDPLLVSWIMSWVAQQVTAGLTNPMALRTFWNAPIFFSEPNTLALSEHFIPQTLQVLPVYWATWQPILAYNLAFLLSFVLTGVATALLTRALTGNLVAGVLAGVVAAFNEFRLVWEVARLQTLSIFWFPFVLLGIHSYLVRGRRRSLVATGIAWIGLNLSSVYYLAYGLGRVDFREADLLWSATALIILISIVLHGVSVTPVMRHLDRRSAGQRAARRGRDRPARVARIPCTNDLDLRERDPLAMSPPVRDVVPERHRGRVDLDALVDRHRTAHEASGAGALGPPSRSSSSAVSRSNKASTSDIR